MESAGVRVEAALEAAYQAVTQYSELHDPKAARPALVFDPVNSAVWIKLVKGSQVSYLLMLLLVLLLLMLLLQLLLLLLLLLLLCGCCCVAAAVPRLLSQQFISSPGVVGAKHKVELGTMETHCSSVLSSAIR